MYAYENLTVVLGNDDLTAGEKINIKMLPSSHKTSRLQFDYRRGASPGIRLPLMSGRLASLCITKVLCSGLPSCDYAELEV